MSKKMIGTSLCGEDEDVSLYFLVALVSHKRWGLKLPLINTYLKLCIMN